MRNIIPLICSRNEGLIEQPDKLINFTYDSERKSYFFITQSKILHGYKPENDEVWLELNLIEGGLLDNDATIVAIEYIPDLEAVCIATRKGEIILYEIEANEADCVGVIDSEITSMTWSPDFEIVIFTTGKHTLLLMTKDWDVLVENAIVSSSETILSSDVLPSVSWRGDGQYFAVNSTDAKGVSSMRIWDRSCVLHSTAEPVQGLGNTTFWKPSGQIIASSQKTPQKHDIIFFERNGLRHGEFSIRDMSAQVLALKWNADSDVLAILLQRTNEKSEKSQCIQLWGSSNYHWSLKQELQFDEVANFLWDSEASMILRVMTTSGAALEYQFCWDYTISSGISHENQSIAGFIDGKSLNMTPLRHVVVPPPMSAFSLPFPATIQSVSFGPQNQFAALLSDNSVAFCGNSVYDRAQRPPFQPTINGIIKGNQQVDFNEIRQIVLLSPTRLLGLSTQSWKNDALFEIILSKGENSMEIQQVFQTNTKKVLRIHHNIDTNNTFVQYMDGSTSLYHPSGGNISSTPTLTPFVFPNSGNTGFATPCPYFASTHLAGEEVLIGLDLRSKLYVNGLLVSTECNSFGFHNKYLAYTTTSNFIRFLLLTQPLNENMSETKTLQFQDNSAREIERGGRISAVVPHDFKIVLQMPRGNLEAIYPTLLIVDLIRELLDEIKYNEAFLLMRRHRIDMNIFYDHNPEKFETHLEDFVRQVNNVDYINLFLSSLRDVDVTKTLYVDPEQLKNIPPQPSKNGKDNTKVEGKVNKLCDRLRQVLQTVDANKFLLSTLTTYVKKNPPQLEEVLDVLRNLREKEKEVVIDVGQLGSAPTKQVSAEEALKYVCWLVDVDKLYDVALGTYDFDLVLMVAQRSQKDPKEYLSYLSELQQMEPFFQRYTIDFSLGRYAKALRSLSQAGEQYFQQCLDLMKNQKLYEVAVDIYSNLPNKEHLSTVLNLYGDYLSSKASYSEAALMYYNCGEDEKALSAFKSASNWRMAFMCAHKLNHSATDLSSLAYDFVESLKSESRFAEASSILFEYCDDVEQGVVTLIEGHEWQEALRKCYESKRVDLIETDLKPAMLEAFHSSKSDIEKWTRKWTKKATRLQVVKQNKILMPQLFGGDKRNLDEETSSFISGMSMYSDASTSSVMSTATTRTSLSTSSSTSSSSSLLSKGSKKSQRKPRRNKRITGREGGPHEEEYLIEVLKRLIPSAKFQEDLSALVKVLVLFNERTKASQLQSSFESYINLVKSQLHLLIPVPAPVVVDDEENENINNKPINKQDAKEQADAKEAEKFLPKVDWKVQLFDA